MAIEDVTIELTFKYDPEKNAGMPLRNYLYHFLNDLGREEHIELCGITYKGATFDATKTPLQELPLRKVDSCDVADVPEAPVVEPTVLDPETNINVARRMQAERESAAAAEQEK